MISELESELVDLYQTAARLRTWSEIADQAQQVDARDWLRRSSEELLEGAAKLRAYLDHQERAESGSQEALPF